MLYGLLLLFPFVLRVVIVLAVWWRGGLLFVLRLVFLLPFLLLPLVLLVFVLLLLAFLLLFLPFLLNRFRYGASIGILKIGSCCMNLFIK